MKSKSIIIFSLILLIISVSSVCASEDAAQISSADATQLSQNQEWYPDTNAENEGDGSQNSPFKTLNTAVENAKDGDTIYVAPGAYKGLGSNVNLTIGKNLNLKH